MEQPKGLISVLISESATIAERDDAAMDLADYDAREAEQALLDVANDPRSPEILLATCGESLAEIWCRRESALPALFTELPALVRLEATAVIEKEQPSWLR